MPAKVAGSGNHANAQGAAGGDEIVARAADDDKQLFYVTDLGDLDDNFIPTHIEPPPAHLLMSDAREERQTNGTRSAQNSSGYKVIKPMNPFVIGGGSGGANSVENSIIGTLNNPEMSNILDLQQNAGSNNNFETMSFQKNQPAPRQALALPASLNGGSQYQNQQHQHTNSPFNQTNSSIYQLDAQNLSFHQGAPNTSQIEPIQLNFTPQTRQQQQ